MVNLHFPYKFRESESLKSFLANEVKEGKNADKNVNQYKSKEGANKQVISSQADSLIKISRIWADFFPANTS
ncbi:hypothetical protein, partial [Klebsiella pneumoniae]